MLLCCLAAIADASMGSSGVQQRRLIRGFGANLSMPVLPPPLPAALQQWLGSSLLADPQHKGRLVWTFDVHGAQVCAGQGR